jgi:DNA-binding transcriptional ArsR family regulator
MENDDAFENAARIFGALSHPNRLKIIKLLSQGELCVEDIQKQITCRQCNVSQHLVILKKENLVSAKKIGRRVYYSLVPNDLLYAISQRSAILH